MLKRCSDINNHKITHWDRTCDSSQSHSTLLHLASELGREEMVHQLLDNGADVFLVDCAQHTPLHVAARYDKIESAKLLIERGALVSAGIGSTSVTALDYAVCQNSASFVKLLLNNGASGDSPETIKQAAAMYCKTGDPTILLVLIAAGIQSKVFKTPGGLLALCGAILHGHLWMAQLLVATGVEPRWNRRLHLGIPSALRLAILRGDHEMEMFLLKGSSLLRMSHTNLSWPPRLITMQ
jgi:ankyrin repeat protein